MSRFRTTIDATGPAGNIFVVLGTARGFLGQMGVDPSEIESVTKRVMAAQSYTDALSVIREWFPVETDED